MNKTYRINDSRVVSEDLDGETIIINLDTGNYYSTNTTASVLWDKIKSSNSLDNILEYFIKNYSSEKSLIEDSIKDSINFLLSEGLILEINLEVKDDEIVVDNNNKKEVFIVPKIDKYDDMQEMLFADPVHDVSENEGWPKLK